MLSSNIQACEVFTDDVAAATMNIVVPSCRLHQSVAVLCLSARCIRHSVRQYSVANPFVVDSERAKLLTSFYYHGAIDKAANKVCVLFL